MTARKATPEEIKNWSTLVSANPWPDETMQGSAYANLKSSFGWSSRYYVFESPGTRIAVMFLVRKLPYFGEIWYAPRGPSVVTISQIKDVMTAIEPELKSAFLVKFEPNILLTDTHSKQLQALGLKKALFDLQLNKSTIIVDLSASEDEIMSGFKQKTRYNIRLSARKGVVVRPVDLTPENIKIMYELLLQTQSRNGFFMRSQAYARSFWEYHTKAGQGQLFFAYLENEVLSGAFVTLQGKKALYKDGGSSREHKNLMAPYTMQWEIMRWLKARGVAEYDLGGAPPKKSLDDKNHPLNGLVQFKTGFNSEVTEYVGVYDWPISPTKYRQWQKFGERLAVKKEITIKKNLFY
ncbi:MAG: peptidoglycan bridge formation glycyltransferase FemA/FemB family protein [bacterium]